MNTRAVQSVLVICVLGIIGGVVFWWQFDSTPDAYRVVSQACEKADTVTEYDMVTYVEHDTDPGRIEWQVSGDEMYGETYDQMGHQIYVLIAGEESYYREPGGEWIEAGVDLSSALNRFPYNSASLCPSLGNVVFVGDGTVDNVPVKRYQSSQQAMASVSGTQSSPNIYSLDNEGWMVQVEVFLPVEGTTGETNMRTVFSDFNKSNKIPAVK